MTNLTHYSESERDKGLLAMIVTGGSVSAARRLLAEQGLSVTDAALSRWRKENPARYADLAARHQPDIDAALIERTSEIALRAADVTMQGIEATEQALEDGRLSNPSGAARDMATVSSLAMEKRRLHQERPTEIREHRDAVEIARALVAQYPSVFKLEEGVIEGTADELPLAEAD